MSKISVELSELVKVYCELHNILTNIDPTWLEGRVLKKEAKEILNKKLAFIKRRIVNQLENGTHRKIGLPIEQNIYKADYEDIIKKLI